MLCRRNWVSQLRLGAILQKMAPAQELSVLYGRRGSQWGSVFYGYRLKILAPLRLSVNFFSYG